MPPEETRLQDEEIKSAVEYERETMGGNTGKKLSTINEEDEFMFNNSRSVQSSDRSKGSDGAISFSENEQNV